MVHLIDKDVLIAEIEQRWRSLANKNVKANGKYDIEICTLLSIKAFINSLEVKDVDLEEKATQLSQKYFPDEYNIWARANIEAQNCKSACIEMVEWFKAQKGE